MLNSRLLKRYRVRSGQIIFWALFIYLFFINPIMIDPLYEAKGFIGLLIATLGLLIRSLSAGYISKNQELASAGLYALTRNPLYFGSFILLIGINIIIWNILFTAITLLLFALTYIPTIANEEKYLSSAFPESWAAFKDGTPRFFPAFWRLRAYGEIQWSFSQWMRNHEYRAVVAFVILILFITWYTW